MTQNRIGRAISIAADFWIDNRDRAEDQAGQAQAKINRHRDLGVEPFAQAERFQKSGAEHA